MSHDPAAEASEILAGLVRLDPTGWYSHPGTWETRGRTQVRHVTHEGPGGRLDVAVTGRALGAYPWARLRAAAPTADATWRRAASPVDGARPTPAPLRHALGGCLPAQGVADWASAPWPAPAYDGEDVVAYGARNLLVALLVARRSARHRAWAQCDEDGGWPVVYVETRHGQVSWHIPPWDLPLLDLKALLRARRPRDAWDGIVHGEDKPGAIRAVLR